jgi:putative transposase
LSARLTAADKATVLDLVRRTVERTDWTVTRVLRQLAMPRARYYEWSRRARADELQDRRPVMPSFVAILPEEKEAVVGYALAHPKDGYRRLTWQMVDADVAYLSPSSVYRILKDADLLYRWKRSRPLGDPPPRPTAPNQRWHTDIMYLRIGDAWYFLVTVLDAYSRYVVHWELLTTMTAADVRLVVQHALESTPGTKPQIVSDNGTQFTAADFKALVRQFEIEHIRIRTYHPESNGVLERFHRSTREELGEQELTSLLHARDVIGRWVKHYNEHRLHAGLSYLPPAEYHIGDPQRRIAERQTKLDLGRARRQAANRDRHQRAA